MTTHTESQPEIDQPSSRKGASYIVADIGGTNARFATYTPDESGIIRHEDPLRFRSADFNELAGAIKAYLEQTGRRVDGACVSIAGPTDSDRIEMTNLDWSFSVSDCRQACGLDTCLLYTSDAADDASSV